MAVHSTQAETAENSVVSAEAARDREGIQLSAEKEQQPPGGVLLRKPVAGSAGDPFGGGDASDPWQYGATAGTYVQRKCAECEEEEKEKLQRKTSDAPPSFLQAKSESNTPVVSDNLSQSIESSAGRGDAMDSPMQTFMSERFGADFSQVKIHNNDQSAQMSRELGARAFTVGNDIYFNEGQYQPHSSGGKHLLAHELTHTIQQGSSLRMKMIQKADEVSEHSTGGFNNQTPKSMDQFTDTSGSSISGYNYWYRMIASEYEFLPYTIANSAPAPMTSDTWDAILSRAWQLRPMPAPSAANPAARRISVMLPVNLDSGTAPVSQHRVFCFFEYRWDAGLKKPAFALTIQDWVQTDTIGDMENSPRIIPKKVSRKTFDAIDNATASGFPGGRDEYFKAHPEVRDTLAGYIESKYRQYKDGNPKGDLSINELSTLNELNGGTPQTVLIHLIVNASKAGGVHHVALKYSLQSRNALSGDYHKKDYADYLIEEDKKKNPAAAEKLGTINGLDAITDVKERLIAKYYAYSFFSHEDKNQANKRIYRDMEVDQIIAISSGTGAAAKIEHYYYTYVIHKADPNGVINIDVKRIGKKGDAAVGDPDKQHVSRIPGYAEASRDASGNETIDIFIKWLLSRYKSVKDADIRDTTIAGVEAKIQPLIEAGSATADWFKNNYSINVLNDVDARKRLKDVHGIADANLVDVKSFSVNEMRLLELAFQRFTLPVLKKLSGLALVRQTADPINPAGVSGRTRTGTYRYNSATKAIISGPLKRTVAIYDMGFKGDDAFLGGEAGVNPATIDTTTHEIGHVLGGQLTAMVHNAPTYQDRFNKFYKDLNLTPVTAYAKDNTNPAAHSTDSEYFPEAYMLFTLDPQWLLTNQFQTWFWFMYFTQVTLPPSLDNAKSMISAWEKQQQSAGGNGLAEATAVYKLWKEMTAQKGKVPDPADLDSIVLIIGEFKTSKQRLPRSEEVKPIITKWKAFVVKNKKQPVATEVITFFP